MPYLLYKVLHYLGLFVLVTTSATALARGARPDLVDDPWRKRLGMIHGISAFLVLLGGFGMLARIGGGMEGWVWAKVLIWVVLGGVLAVARRSPIWSSRLLWIVPLLATLAGVLAYTKPF